MIIKLLSFEEKPSEYLFRLLNLFLLLQPGECKSVILVSIAGKKVIRGGNGIVDGTVDVSKFPGIMDVLARRGISSQEEASARL